MINAAKTPIERLTDAARTFVAMGCDATGLKAVSSITADDPARQQAFSDPKGMSIGQLAKLFQMPVSTVRHYVELGLIEPITVNGKFRFTFYNATELEHVRQWASLGMKLEDIVARRKTGVVGMMDERGDETVLLQRITDPEMVQVINERVEKAGKPIVLSKEEALEFTQQLGLSPDLPQQRLLADYDVLIEQLEIRMGEINAQLERAKVLRQQLAKVQNILKTPA
jgi:DNA-binding transcriptional MerR regulator